MDNTHTEQNDTLPAEEPRELCTNCGKKMAKKGKYCPHCGQERFDGRVPFRALTKKFIYKLTNLDNKLLRMMWRLLIPAQVTLDYFAGKIKQYPHPFQFFFVVMFFFLLVFSKVVDTSKGIQFNFNSKANDVELTSADPANQAQETKQSNFYFMLERYVFSREIQIAYDSLPRTLQTPSVKESLKIILDKTNGRWTRQMDTLFREEKTKDSLSLNFGKRALRIAYKDIVERSPEEIILHYGIKDWVSQILLKQSIRSIQNPSDLMTAYVGSFSWTILALIFAMAGCLKLFYWRQKRYFVEHFVLLMHWHSGVFLVLTFILGYSYFMPLNAWWGIIMGGAAIFMLLTMKRFYGQNWFWSTFKWFWFLMIYLLGFSILFVLGLLVVFAVF